VSAVALVTCLSPVQLSLRPRPYRQKRCSGHVSSTSPTQALTHALLLLYCTMAAATPTQPPTQPIPSDSCSGHVSSTSPTQSPTQASPFSKVSPVTSSPPLRLSLRPRPHRHPQCSPAPGGHPSCINAAPPSPPNPQLHADHDPDLGSVDCRQPAIPCSEWTAIQTQTQTRVRDPSGGSGEAHIYGTAVKGCIRISEDGLQPQRALLKHYPQLMRVKLLGQL